MRNKFYGLAALLCLPLLLGNEGGCGSTPNPATTNAAKQAKALGQQVAAANTQNNEAEMIAFKRMTMGKPGLIGYVAFIADDGRPIQYLAIKGKCTSGGKRLEKSYEFLLVNNAGSPSREEVVPGPTDDGTYGSSGEYIYCRTMNDAYVQWNGKYYYSTQPFDLRVPALVVTLGTQTTGQ